MGVEGHNAVVSREASRPLWSAPTAQLAERTVLALANTEHYLDTAAHYLEGAERGLADRQEDLAPDVVDGWSTTVHDSNVELINCHLSTLEGAATNWTGRILICVMPTAMLWRWQSLNT